MEKCSKMPSGSSRPSLAGGWDLYLKALWTSLAARSIDCDALERPLFGLLFDDLLVLGRLYESLDVDADSLGAGDVCGVGLGVSGLLDGSIFKPSSAPPKTPGENPIHNCASCLEVLCHTGCYPKWVPHPQPLMFGEQVAQAPWVLKQPNSVVDQRPLPWQALSSQTLHQGGWNFLQHLCTGKHLPQCWFY